MKNFPTSNLIVDIKKWGSTILSKVGISNAAKEVDWYLSSISKIDVLNQTQYLNNIEIKKFKNFISDRINNKPFQYIIQSAPFYNEFFFVNHYVLIPRPETELIIRILSKKKPFYNAIDIGTGSGNLGITICLNNLAKKVIGTDKSHNALTVAKQNAKQLNASNIRFQYHDFLKHKLNQQYDLVVSNPPYISKNEYKALEPHIKNFEPKIALTDGVDGMIFYRQFALSLKDILKPGGTLLLEIGYESTKPNIHAMFQQTGCKIKWHKDYNHNYRVIEVSYE